MGVASAQPPAPSLAPWREAAEEPSAPVSFEDGEDGMDAAAADMDAPLNEEEVFLDGVLAQGGLVTGRTHPDNRLDLDGRNVAIDENGYFVFGFNRDHGPTARLTVTYPDDTSETKMLSIEPRTWRESRITVEESKANPYLPADIEKIQEDRKKKDAARAARAEDAFWVDGFIWPVESGCVSSPFGYRRIVNGEPRRFHSGVDLAAPDGMSPSEYVGTVIVAPAPGIVTLSDPDMFFEGGLVFIDHGQQLESAIMHMSAVTVRAGDVVQQGDIIGAVGRTGRVTGPHMHWSLKWQDRLLDPELTVDERPVCTD